MPADTTNTSDKIATWLDADKLWEELARRPLEFTMARDLPLHGRTIRAVCKRWPEHFISGRKGYKLAQYATDAEIEYSINDLNSRSMHMLRRSRTLQKMLVSRHHQPDMIGMLQGMPSE